MSLVLLLTLTATVALAAPSTQMVTCEDTYVVQADDWLSKLADRYYSDMFTYPAIVVATNLMATTDGTFTQITNPDIIEIGQKLCIPGAEAVEGLVAAFEENTQEPITAEPKLVWVDSVAIQMVDGEYVATLVGNFPDGCSTLGEAETTVTGNNIVVTVFADSPPDAVCALGLVPFEETITLDLSEIAPGEYTVVVNETTTTPLAIN
jgi:LysM repeat protein